MDVTDFEIQLFNNDKLVAEMMATMSILSDAQEQLKLAPLPDNSILNTIMHAKNHLFKAIEEHCKALSIKVPDIKDSKHENLPNKKL